VVVGLVAVVTPNADSERYPPGVWVDTAGALHFDIEAMIRGAGYEPTPENLRAMEKAALGIARQIGATVTVKERSDDAP
jgi:hypothetical protein